MALKANSPKVVYLATFEDGKQYVGFCDKDCKRLRPFVEGRVGFKGRLQTKFAEQYRCWGYTAPVYLHAYAGFEVTSAKIVKEVANRAEAIEFKNDYARTNVLLGHDILNTIYK